MKLKVIFDIPDNSDHSYDSLKNCLSELDSIRTNLEFEWGDYYIPNRYCVGKVSVDSIEAEVTKMEKVYES